MPNDQPKVSIIMGIYNCSQTLGECIDSLLEQTYSNWELIMCDDGSTDSTYFVAKEYEKKYENIFLLKNDVNRGLAYSLNQCINHATGEYIARQDGDDRSIVNRLEKQVSILRRNPEYDIVSSGMVFFDETGQWGKIISVEKPGPYDFIQQSPFCHAPSIMRREALLKVNGYNTDKKTYRAEDYDLWFRMYANGSLGYNIQDCLYEVRDDRNALKRRTYKYRINEAYVRYTGYNLLKLPWYSNLYATKSLFVGLVPNKIYRRIRRMKYKYT